MQHLVWLYAAAVLALHVKVCKAEEESILKGALVSDFEIDASFSPEPNALIGPRFAESLATTSGYDYGPMNKEFRVELKDAVALHTIYLGASCRTQESYYESMGAVELWLGPVAEHFSKQNALVKD